VERAGLLSSLPEVDEVERWLGVVGHRDVRADGPVLVLIWGGGAVAGCLVVGHHPSGIQVRQWVSSSADHSLLAVVNNAGVGSGGLIDWLTLSDFERDAAVNYFGTVRVSKAFLPLLKQAAAQWTRRAPRPRVVVVCSASGKVGVNIPPWAYSKSMGLAGRPCAYLCSKGLAGCPWAYL